MFSDNRIRPPWWMANLALVGLLLTGVVGCGPGDPYDEIPVSGKVTYDDGSLITAARVQLGFESQLQSSSSSVRPKPGIADVNLADGTFSEATSVRFGDGLIAGRHKVSLFIFDEAGNQTELEITGISSIDGGGNATALKVPPAEIEVSSGTTKFEFKVLKPK